MWLKVNKINSDNIVAFSHSYRVLPFQTFGKQVYIFEKLENNNVSKKDAAFANLTLPDIIKLC